MVEDLSLRDVAVRVARSSASAKTSRIIATTNGVGMPISFPAQGSKAQVSLANDHAGAAYLHVGNSIGLTSHANVQSARSSHLHTLHVYHPTRTRRTDDAVTQEIAPERPGRCTGRRIFQDGKSKSTTVGDDIGFRFRCKDED